MIVKGLLVITDFYFAVLHLKNDIVLKFVMVIDAHNVLNFC